MSNYVIYLVGGAVRDKLLGRYANECDWVVVGAKESDMFLMKFYKVGKDFPVFIHPVDKEEYALARMEIKTGFGYYGFSCNTYNVGLKKDLFRRDLTINSLVLNSVGKLIDPYTGYIDLQQRLLKHISIAFKDDPLRILRLSRFYVKFIKFVFMISVQTYSLIRVLSTRKDVAELAKNRIWQEIVYVLKSDFPMKFFELLYYFGILKYIFFDYYILYGLYLKHDIYKHILNKLKKTLECVTYFTVSSNIKFVIIFYYLRYIFISKFKNYNSVFKYKQIYCSSINKYMKNYCIPNDYSNFALYMCKFSFFYYRLCKLKTLYIFHILNSVKAFKKKKQFINIVFICELNMKFELNILNKSYFYKYLVFDIIDNINNKKILLGDTKLNMLNIKSILFINKLMILEECKKKYNKYFNQA